jgi:hypothetical protein
MPQQSGNLAIAIPAILACQCDDVGAQPLLVVAALWNLALRRAVLSERRTGTALGYVKFAANMLDRHGGVRGLEVSLVSLLQDQRQVGDRLAQPRILSLQIL